MQAMRYQIETPKHPKIQELSVFIENYNKETFFIFINNLKGAFRLSVEDGKKRLEMVDKATSQCFQLTADTSVVYDLVDTMINLHTDISVLLNKYLNSKSNQVAPQALASVQPTSSIIPEEKFVEQETAQTPPIKTKGKK